MPSYYTGNLLQSAQFANRSDNLRARYQSSFIYLSPIQEKFLISSLCNIASFSAIRCQYFLFFFMLKQFKNLPLGFPSLHSSPAPLFPWVTAPCHSSPSQPDFTTVSDLHVYCINQYFSNLIYFFNGVCSFIECQALRMIP